MGIDPISLGLEGAALGEAGAKGAEGASALAPLAEGGLGAAAAPQAAAGLAPLVEGVDFTTAAAGAADAAASGIPQITINALPAAAGAGEAAGLADGGGIGAGLINALSPSSAAAATPNADTLAESGINPPASVVPSAGATPTTTPAPTTLGLSSPVAPAGGASAASIGGGDIISTGIDATPSIGPGPSPDPTSLAPPAASSPAATAAKAATSGGIGDFLSNNKALLATLGLGAGGIVASPMLSKLVNKVPQQSNLTDLAARESSLASQQQSLSKTLTDPLTTGVLPSGAETSVTNATNDAIATTKAKYANLGLSGSTMEADAIANISNQATAARFSIAQQMATTGESAASQAASALGLENQVYSQLMSAQISQDNALTAAIAQFAGAAALGQGINAANKKTA